MYRPDTPNDLLKVDEHTQWLTVVGVVGDIHMDDIKGNNTVGAYYFPLSQETSRFVTFAVKTRKNPESIIKTVRAAIGTIDPELAVFDVRTLNDSIDLSLLPRRTAMLLSTAFAIVAMFLCSVGIYGVLAYLVAQRSREIGIRIALGSSGSGVFRLVLKEGMWLVAAGLIIGGGGAVALRSLIESQIYGVRPLDPIVLGSVAAVLVAVAFAACALPARRATRVDPVRVLSA
jgi:putative ABC transport system permease protein